MHLFLFLRESIEFDWNQSADDLLNIEYIEKMFYKYYSKA